MRTIENSLRVSIDQLRSLDGWEKILEKGEATIRIEHDGKMVPTTVALGFDQVNYGRRAWLKCPDCDRNRRDLFIDCGELRCRKCAGLLYFVQRLPASSWRAEVALPLLRTLRGKPWGRLPEQGWQ